jgi:hypothetical protein
MRTSLSFARALHREKYLSEFNEPEDVARLAGVPLGLVLEALHSGDLPGREFPAHGWRITKRAALTWMERRTGTAPEESADAQPR